MPLPTLLRFSTLLLMPLVAAACTTTRGASANSTLFDASSSDEPVLRRRDILTEDEIRRTNAANGLDALIRLRPEFVRNSRSQSDNSDVRSTQSRDGSQGYGRQQQPTVFVDGFKYGGLTTLRQIPTSAIREIRYYYGVNVPVKYGAGLGPVIDVRTKG